MNRRASWLPVLPGAAWRLLGGECLSAVGSGLTLPFLLVYLHEVRGLDLAVAGLAMACLAAAGFVANPLGGALSDRARARRSSSGWWARRLGRWRSLPSASRGRRSPPPRCWGSVSGSRFPRRKRCSRGWSTASGYRPRSRCAT